MSNKALNADRLPVTRLAYATLAPANGGVLVFSTNSRHFKLDEAALPAGVKATEISERSVPEGFRNRRIHHCWRIG